MSRSTTKTLPSASTWPQDGRLREGWSVERAAEWAWSRSHLEAWQQLVVECGWDAADAGDRMTRSILAEVVGER